MTQEGKDFLHLHFIVLIWGFTAILGLLIELPPVEVVFFRTFISALGLWMLLKVRGRTLRIHSIKMLGIILGTLFAIFFCTCIVAFVFWLLQDESPRFTTELEGLGEIVRIFLVLTLFAAGSFIGSLRSARWRHAVMLGLWAGLALTGYYYWP